MTKCRARACDKDNERWWASDGLCQACRNIEDLRAAASEKAKPPKGRAVALSTTCQEFYIKTGGC